MATRVIERQLDWCKVRIEEFLLENGYQAKCSKGKEKTISGKYAGADKRRMLLRSRIEVGLAPLSNRVTHVRVRFRLYLLVAFVVSFSWVLVGFAPFLIMLKLTAQDSDLHPLWTVLGWVATAGWMLYFLVRRFALAVGALDDHMIDTEKRLWQHLDPEDLYSHEIDSASPTWRAVFSFSKWASFCLMIMGVGMLRDSPSGGAYMLLIGGAVLFVTIGWVTCSLALPHRFHWKVGFYTNYLCWWVIVSAPCMMIPCYGMDPDLLLGFGCQDALIGITFCLQALMLQAGLRMLPDFRDEEKARVFYSPPSARYEALSEQNVVGDIRWLLKKHRLWTWANFILFTVLFYSAALYLVTVLVESTAGILGAKWVFTRSQYWPLLVDLEGRLAAIEAFLLTCIIGSPMLFSVAQAIRALRKSMRTLAFVRETGLDLAQARLPAQPVECMRSKLGTDRILVVEVPDLLVNVKLEKKGFLKKHYLLWLSLGAQKALSGREMESLLWHECGHAELIKCNLWRDIAAILAPWGPRFLDLMENLYEKERAADLFAVHSMGNTGPLKSALRKVRNHQRRFSRKTKSQERGIHNLRDGFAFLKVVWNLDWVGYVHPNIDQRLHWLEEWETQGVIDLC